MNSPFNQEQAELLNRLLPTLTESQKIWLSGYLAAAQPAIQAVSALGTLEAHVAEVPTANAGPTVSKEVTILYGSQTGNAQKLAGKAGKTLRLKDFK
jgi:sulfite reductase (NADPH) flavoprotein alpha-component